MDAAMSRDLGRLFLEANPTPEERQTIVAALNSAAGAAARTGEELPGPAGPLVAELRRRAAARAAAHRAAGSTAG